MKVNTISFRVGITSVLLNLNKCVVKFIHVMFYNSTRDTFIVSGFFDFYFYIQPGYIGSVANFEMHGNHKKQIIIC